MGKFGLTPAEALLARKVVIVEGPLDVTFIRILTELQTGRTPDRQDIVVVPAGGKHAAAELALFLSELGAAWTIAFDWDAVESTSMPLFVDGLTAVQRGALAGSVASIQGDLRSMPGRLSRAQKILQAMATELAVPPAPVASYVGSILEGFATKNNLFSAAEVAGITNCIQRRQHVKIRDLINPKGIWLWSGTIEEVILRNTAAELAAEAYLIAHGELAGPHGNSVARRAYLLSRIHNSAHEPEVLRGIVEHLWRNSLFKGSEVKAAIRYLLR